MEIAKDFMKGYLPVSILDIVDFSTLELQKDSHINKQLQEVFSDLLFKVDINNKEGYIYFLFEHKSYRDRLVIFQLLRYMVEIWESKVEKQGLSGLPVIIPLVIYHDKGEWRVKTKLSDMIIGYNQLPEDVKKYIPSFEYLIYDLTKYNDEDIKLESVTRIIIKIMRDVRHASKD
ncbi:MAG TPA: Rpn family recombination-promoting nuclease/putative transposase, partial [Clostridiales bacterium]|nr:Rpn family recombination-promoting nuclease/putative transposase [Clostridiales bacterium]